MIRSVSRPKRLEDLWPLLEDGAVVFAGGTDLMVRRRLDEKPWDAVLVEGLPGLAEIREEEKSLRLGAGATHADLLGHPLVRDRLPLLAAALSVLGSPLIRNMGTLGGNMATASPAGDCLPPLYALDARVELLSRAGERRMPVEEFFLGPGRTALAPGEIIAAVLVRPPSPASRQRRRFEKVGQRKALAIAVASLAAVIEQNARGEILAARLALGSVGPTVLRCPRAEASLIGRPLDREALSLAGEIIREEIAPIDDLRASAAYRRTVAGNLPLRLLA